MSGRNKYPLGIRFWVSINDDAPKMEVYDCMGPLNKESHWAFKSIKENKLISKSYSELIENRKFKPFLLNLEKLRKQFGAL